FAQPPRTVLDVAAVDAALRADGVVAVALGEEGLQRSALRRAGWRDGPVRGGEIRAVGAAALKAESAVSTSKTDRRVAVWQAEPRPGHCHRQPVGAVQAQEEHARLMVVADVGAQIDFRKTSQPWRSGQT